MNHQHRPTRNSNNHQPHQRPGSHDQHRMLDLDAEVFGEHLAAVLDSTGVPAGRTVVDLGAGTGAGSRLLRARYPDAAVLCIDNDPQMIELLREQGFVAIEADLDDGFPGLAGALDPADAVAEAPVDLAWASSSLHHLVHAARLLSEVRRALAPEGALVIVELASLPRFLSHPRGVQLEQRCHAAAAAEGWNNHPNWTPVIEAAGFDVTQSEVTTIAPVTEAAREYAQQWFARFSQLAALPADDRGTVQELSERLPDDIELEPSATRTVWVATPTRAGKAASSRRG